MLRESWTSSISQSLTLISFKKSWFLQFWGKEKTEFFSNKIILQNYFSILYFESFNEHYFDQDFDRDKIVL